MQVLAHWIVLLLVWKFGSEVGSKRVVALHLLVLLVTLAREASMCWAELCHIRSVCTVAKVDVVVHVVKHGWSLLV